jgi:hypothetical protein
MKGEGMKRLHTTMAAFALAVVFAVPVASYAANYEFELIALKGDPFWGSPPLTLMRFGKYPSINNDGTVAFSADSGINDVGGTNGGVFTSSGGVTTLLAKASNSDGA